jgi:hypothetical protein
MIQVVCLKHPKGQWKACLSISCDGEVDRSWKPYPT